MTATEQITSKIKGLPNVYQQEVLDFVEFLSEKARRGEATNEDEAWKAFSLTQAMSGLEDDPTPEYGEDDLKEKWR